MTFYNHAAKKPTSFNSLSDAMAWNQARTEERRAQRKLEREADPEFQARRQESARMQAERRAAEEEQKAEAEKHSMVGWPGGLSAHVDRGTAKAKASFVQYLAKAVADYERAFPDQAPAPLVDVQQEVTDRRNAESRARARALETCTSRSDLERLLAVQPADIGQEEIIARSAARHKLRLMAANPGDGEFTMVGERTVEVQHDPTPAPADAAPVRRGPGRPPKFLKQVESTPDGAIIED